jgi:hypothetical protein
MCIFFKCRIIVGGQHFAVGININPASLALVKQFFQILQRVEA